MGADTAPLRCEALREAVTEALGEGWRVVMPRHEVVADAPGDGEGRIRVAPYDDGEVRLTLCVDLPAARLAPALRALRAAVEGEAGEWQAEREAYSIRLDSYGDRLFAVMQAVRYYVPLPLPALKRLVEGAPCVVAERVDSERADEILRQIVSAGGRATVLRGDRQVRVARAALPDGPGD